jgi:hypothetical protein
LLSLKRKEATFAIVQGAIFILILALVAIPSQVQSPAAPPAGPCANVPSVSPYSASLAPVRNETRLSNGTLVNDTYYPTFFLKPNSNGIFCYTYSVSSGKTTLNLLAGKNYFIGTYGIHGIVPLNGNELSIAAEPSTLTLQHGRNETVAYTLTAGNSTGFYQALVPPADCVGLPVFVGSGTSQVNSTAYTQLSAIENWICTGLYNLNVESIGLVNIEVRFVGAPGVMPGNDTWEIIQSDVSVPGNVGYLAECVAFGFPCPNTDYPMQATLVLYQGTYYYISDLPASANNGASPIVHYTVWYTNSTVYCVGPGKHTLYPTCP